MNWSILSGRGPEIPLIRSPAVYEAESVAHPGRHSRLSLADYFLFPGVVAPLQVFETRYRQMMSDLMDGPGRLTVAAVAPDGPRTASGPVLPAVGTLAEIMRHEEMPDGRWLILLAALDRVAITEVPTERLYRRVDAGILPEPTVTGEPATAVRKRVIEAVQVRASGSVPSADEVSLGRLADLLLHALGLDAVRARAAYFEKDPVNRAVMALAWHDLQAATEK